MSKKMSKNKVYERFAYSATTKFVYERCTDLQQKTPKSVSQKQIQEPSLKRDALESKKRKVSSFEQALSQEKQKAAKLEREKAQVKQEIKQHKMLDNKLQNVKSALDKAKFKNKQAEGELKNLKSAVPNNKRQQTKTNVKVLDDKKQQTKTNVKVEQSWYY